MQETRVHRRYDGETLVLHTDLRRKRQRSDCGLHGRRAAAPRADQAPDRTAGLPAPALRNAAAVRLRADASAAAVIKMSQLVAICGADFVVLRCRLPLQIDENDAPMPNSIYRKGRSLISCLPTARRRSKHRSASMLSRELEATLAFWRRLGGSLSAPDRMAGPRHPVAVDVEGANLPCDRRHGLGPHYISAGGAGGDCQLGLPILLAA